MNRPLMTALIGLLTLTSSGAFAHCKESIPFGDIKRVLMKESWSRNRDIDGLGDPKRIQEVDHAYPRTREFGMFSPVPNVKASEVILPVLECNGYQVGGVYQGYEIEEVFADGTFLSARSLHRPAPNTARFDHGDMVLFQPGEDVHSFSLVRVE
jgi:hypothetical protein